MTTAPVLCFLLGLYLVQVARGAQQQTIADLQQQTIFGTAVNNSRVTSPALDICSVVNDSATLTFPSFHDWTAEREIRYVTLTLPVSMRDDENKNRDYAVIVQNLNTCETHIGKYMLKSQNANVLIPRHWSGNWTQNTLRLTIWFPDEEGIAIVSSTNGSRIILVFADVVCKTGEHVEKTKVCNFHADCRNGEDEIGCGESCKFDKECLWIRTSSQQGQDGFNITEAPTIAKGAVALLRNDVHPNGFQAHLTSPWYGSSGPRCQLNFDLYMSGRDVGSVEVRILTETSDKSHSVWTQQGDRGNIWQHINADIGKVEEPFRMQITATRGGDIGCIALDNITFPLCDPELTEVKCTLQEFMCRTRICISRDSVCDFHEDCVYGEDEAKNCDNLPREAYCNFEDEDLCGWSNVQHDAFNWTRHKGETPSDGTGPAIDHTYGHKKAGHYIYIEASFKKNGQNAILESVTYPPTPPQNSDMNSPYHNTCKLRFFRHMYGENIGLLEVFLIENGQQRRRLYHEFGTNEDVWEKVVIPIHTASSYKLQLVGTTTGMRFRGDIAVDDLSLSAECFGAGVYPESLASRPKTCSVQTHSTQVAHGKTTLKFTTCGNTGPFGPSQDQCKRTYTGKMEVIVVKGIQKWTVNHTAVYRITVAGGSGGEGAPSNCVGRGSTVTSYFWLNKGDILHMMVGQQGTCACCLNDTAFLCDGENFSRKTMGGGGGGASFVYKISIDGVMELLVVAGGGGGRGPSAILQPPSVSLWPHDAHQKLPGSGGSWNHSGPTNKSGQALHDGGSGGTCPGGGVPGGFGGGGAGCPGPGGGGGYHGGRAGQGFWENAVAGSSYISDIGLKTQCTPDSNLGAGYVKISFPICTCSRDCDDTQSQKCLQLCAPGSQLSAPNFTCIEQGHTLPPSMPAESDDHLSKGYLFILVLGGIVFVTFLIAIAFWLAKHYRKKKPSSHRLDALVEEDLLSRLRQGENPIVTEFNPNYDFNGRANSLQDLREITRNDLQLDRALGQGAFGEVYRGLLAGVSREGGKIQVAVKTLPALCTDQAEMDFLMEAIIISKFRHPNIVRFIGVCFERHPRFIILELLQGGDLKSFLRECRINQNQEAASLTVKDLLSLSIDIAKGCQHLEDNHFIHRDIAARNCLLTTKGPTRIAKIADFGMARDIYRADYYRKGGKAMLPVKWMPPEAFLDGVFTSMTDVWSYGILLWEIFTLGYMPYPGKGNEEVMEFVTTGGRMDPPVNCPLSISMLMTLCWSGRSEHRPNFANIRYLLNSILNDTSVIHGKLCSQDVGSQMNNSARPTHTEQRPLLTVQPTIQEVDELVPLNRHDSQNGSANVNNIHHSFDKLLMENDNNTKLEDSIKETHRDLTDCTDHVTRCDNKSQPVIPLTVCDGRMCTEESRILHDTDLSDSSDDEATNSSSLLIKTPSTTGSNTWL